MRTTVTLDPDTEVLVRRRMRERRVSFKQALNDAIRDGAKLDDPPLESRWTRTYSMGTPRFNVDKALQLAGDLEDEEIIRKMRRDR